MPAIAVIVPLFFLGWGMEEVPYLGVALLVITMITLVALHRRRTRRRVSETLTEGTS